MVGIEDVARLAGVSPATVSRALRGIANVSDDLTIRVKSAADQLGYVPSATAHALATGQTHNIGVILPSVSTWFFSQVLDGIQSTLTKAGYDLTLYCLGDDIEDRRRKFFENLMPRRRLDGVITVAVQLQPEDIADLARLNCPFVSVGGHLQQVQTLCIDDFEVGATAANHLLQLGHTKIGHIGGSPRSETDHTDPNQRSVGFQATLEKAGIAIDADWILDGNFSVADGYKQAMTMLKQPENRPTAIFSSSDEMGFGIIKAAADLGIAIPAQLSIIGVDNHSLSAFYDLTTIDQNVHGQGQRAAEELLKIIADKGAVASTLPNDIRLPVELLKRSSTGLAPQ